MLTDLKAWNHLLYCSVFYDSENASNDEVVSQLTEFINKAFAQVRFDSSISVSYLNPFSTTDLKPTERNWTTIKKRSKEGRMGAISYGSIHPNGRTFQVGVSVRFYNQQPAVIGGKSYSSPNLITFWVDRYRLEDGIVSINTCINLMEEIWKFAGGIYGNADYFISHYTGATNPQQEFAAASYFGAKIFRTDHPPTHLNIYQEVPDIYWLNFLGKQHVKTIFDHDSSRQDLSEFAVQELSHGGLEILLSPSPFVVDALDLQQMVMGKATLSKLLVEQRHR